MDEICTVQKKKKKSPSYEVRDIEFIEPPLALTEEEAQRQAADLLLGIEQPLEKPELNSRCNRPDAVRKEFLKYLRSGLGYQADFTHPILEGETFSNALIHRKLFELKNYFSLLPVRPRQAATHQSQENQIEEVRKAFLDYLKIDFPTGRHWKNPSSSRVYSNVEVREALNHYKEAYDGLSALHYKSLWCLFTTQASRTFISQNFGFGDNSVLRLWHDAIDGIMLILDYRDLNPHFGGEYHKDYHALWCLISTRTTRSQASEYFNLSDSSIKRLWNDLIDPLLLALAYPDISMETAMTLYKNRG